MDSFIQAQLGNSIIQILGEQGYPHEVASEKKKDLEEIYE